MLNTILSSVVCLSVFVSGGQTEREVQKVIKDGSALMLYYVQRVDKVYEQVKDLQTKTPIVDNRISKLTREVDDLKSAIGKLHAIREPVVYFRALLSTRKRFGAGSTVVFDQVDANTGGGYNPRSGIFTAPISGLYEFKCQLQTTGSGDEDYIITSQGTGKALLTLRGAYVSNTMSAIFSVTAGDHVWILGRWDDGKKPKLREGMWSQFSGYLLRRD